MSALDQLQLGQLIARSHLSSIFLGKVNACTCVIKIPLPGSDAAASVQQEKSALTLLHSSNRPASGNIKSTARTLPDLPCNDLDGRKHIIQLLGHYKDNLGDALVLEQLGHSLHQIQRARTRKASDTDTQSDCQGQASPLPISCVKQLAKHLFLALHHVHSNGWIHRDVKPSNLMTALPVIGVRRETAIEHSNGATGHEQQQSISADPLSLSKKPPRQHSVHVSFNRLKRTHWKLIDFGNAVQYHAQLNQPTKQTSSLSYCGLKGVPSSLLQTPSYTPPEDLLGLLPQGGNHTQRAQRATSTLPSQAVPWAHPGNDMWAAGCVLYEAATGHKLFDVHRCRALLQSYMCQQHQIPRSFTINRADSTPVSGITSFLRLLPAQLTEGITMAVGSHKGRVLAIDRLEDDDIQLWQMVHTLGPVDSKVVSRACLQAATSLDAEGDSRLDHHPAAQDILAAASALQLGDSSKAGTKGHTRLQPNDQLNTRHKQAADSKDELQLCAVLPLQQRMLMEGSHIPEQERLQLADLLTGLLQYTPEDRLTGARALMSAFVADSSTKTTD